MKNVLFFLNFLFLYIILPYDEVIKTRWSERSEADVTNIYLSRRLHKIFQDLSKFTKICQNFQNLSNLPKFVKFAKFLSKLLNFVKFAKICQKYPNLSKKKICLKVIACSFYIYIYIYIYIYMCVYLSISSIFFPHLHSTSL